MNFSKYLGFHISKLLVDLPFSNWAVEKSIEEDLEEKRVFYVFPGKGLQLRCDSEDNIRVIFLDDSGGNLGKTMADLSFSQNRSDVIEKLGCPSKSGEKRKHPILGDYGAWDRFPQKDYTLHIEYRPDSETIRQITFMKNENVPD